MTIEWQETKKGNKMYRKNIAGHELKVYESSGSFRIDVDNFQGTTYPEEIIEVKIKEYEEKLPYVHIPKFLEYEKALKRGANQRYSRTSADDEVRMCIHNEYNKFVPYVNATDVDTGEKMDRILSPGCATFEEAIDIINSKMDYYDEHGKFIREGTAPLRTRFVEEENAVTQMLLEECYSIETYDKRKYEFLKYQSELYDKMNEEAY